MINIPPRGWIYKPSRGDFIQIKQLGLIRWGQSLDLIWAPTDAHVHGTPDDIRMFHDIHAIFSAGRREPVLKAAMDAIQDSVWDFPELSLPYLERTLKRRASSSISFRGDNWLDAWQAIYAKFKVQ